MKNTIIGTAGHVDHGKTMLIKALTGIDTDRLKEEKKRGITIDLGFAWLDLPDGRRAGIIDVPGHERFIKNMLAGAGGIDLAILIIAADDGIMPQTREHLDILRLLDIQNGIIAVTKTDLVDEEWLSVVIEDILQFAKGSFLENAPIVPVSAYTGRGIEELREQIINRLDDFGNDVTAAFRVPVDRVFTMEGFGTVITGTLLEGSLSEGEEVEIYPRKTRARVRNLQVHSESVTTAFAGQRLAVNLAGLKRDGISRGDVVALPGSMQNGRMLDVKLQVLKNSKRTLLHGSRLHFYHGSRDELCKLILLGTEELKPGEEGYAQLRFKNEIAVKKGDRFVVRFYSPVETVGGGVILDTDPQKHRRSDKQVLNALKIREQGSPQENLLQAISDGSPQFLTLTEIQQKLSALDNAEFKINLETLISQGRAIRLSKKTVISDNFKEMLGRQLRKILEDYHKANPLQSGMRRDELRSKLLPKCEVLLADKILELYLQEGKIRANDSKIALTDFKIEYTAADKKLSEEIEALFLEAGFTPPPPEEFFMRHQKNKAAAQRVFDALLEDKRLEMVSPQLFYHRDVVKNAFTIVENYIRQHGAITLAEFRDQIGASRKYALSLLEYFDRQGKTRKIDDRRMLAKG